MTTASSIPYSPDDPCSFANTDEARTTHIHLDLTADFDAKLLRGSATLTVGVRKGTQRVVLDTSYLAIKKTVALCDASGEVDLKHYLGERHAKFGTPLVIHLHKTEDEDVSVRIRIDYETTDQCTAIGWLAPVQTVGKQHPYLFSQCQAIHARSMLPCQDTPLLKLTYTASVTVPAPLVALMSALRVTDKTQHHGSRSTYHFEQKTTIPSYLIALAVGNIKGIDVGPRTTVFAEPEVVEQAAKEFEDTEKIIQVGEQLIMPYEWGRYDILVLPASFPYGGMENPNLTFVTPTLLAGDKSLVDVIIHEFSHSYSGNLVTTKDWQSFWLNEGWTMFIERKILGRMHGEPSRQFSAINGVKALEESIEHLGATNRLTALKPDLKETDPDDAFSSVPYEKGFNFLYYLEQLLGGPEVFEPYMQAYFKRFAHQSIDTKDWKEFLYWFMDHYFGEEKVKLLDTQVDWDKWLTAPGMPPVENKFDRTLADACDTLGKRWADAKTDDSILDSFTASDLKKFTTMQQIVFLDQIDSQTPLPHKLLVKMNELYDLSSVRNAEIRFRWQKICLQSNYEPVYPHVSEFLGEVGRMKYVRPLYRALNAAKNGRPVAVETFAKLRETYHPICAQQVAKDLAV
ncbi:Leucyl aminopeptidase yscIV [Sorochytrium milnesiophthora]